MARQGFSDVQNAKPFEDLYVASDRAAMIYDIMSVDLKWDGKALTGTVHSINPQRADVSLQKTSFAAASGAVHMEADAPNPRGGAAIHYIIDGKLANGVITGSWNHGASKGDFK